MVEAYDGSPVLIERYDETKVDRDYHLILLYFGWDHAIVPTMMTGKEAILPACAIVVLALELVFGPAATSAIANERVRAASDYLTPSAGYPNQYIVRRGDTLNSIARKCGTSASNIRLRIKSPPAPLALTWTPVPQEVGSRSVPLKPRPTPRFEPTIAP